MHPFHPTTVCLTRKNTKHVRNEKWFFEQPQRLDDVRLRKEYIISQGHNVEEVWECEYDSQMQNNKDIRDFNSTRAPIFFLNSLDE